MSATMLPGVPATVRPAPVWRPALLVLAAGVLALLGLFHTEAAAALKVWGNSTAFGHCFLVAPIAGWLAWERRGALAGLGPRPVPLLAGLALPLVAVWFVAERLGLMEGRQLCALVLAWLLTLAVLGFSVGRAMAVPLAYTVFLVPFGAFLVPALQDFTARFIDVGLAVLDIPHVVTNTIIEIPEGTFQVAEACAGLRFLIAAVAFGALYACVIYRSAWRRVAFIAVCMVVPVLANGLRALGIVLLGHALGSAEAGAVDHVLYGWLFFSLVLLLLLLLGLPFRQESRLAPPQAVPQPRPRPHRMALAVAAVAVVGVSASGPAASAWLAWQARGDAGTLAAEANRLAGAVVIPPGCRAADPVQGRRVLTCNGATLEVRIRVFAPLAGPVVLAAWRDAAETIGAEESGTTWIERPHARWRVVTAQAPDRIAASALWLDGAPAPGGLALRVRLATGVLRQGGISPVLAVITAPATPEAAAPIADLMAAVQVFTPTK